VNQRNAELTDNSAILDINEGGFEVELLGLPQGAVPYPHNQAFARRRLDGQFELQHEN
jgi:hypothetical protein